MCGLRGKRRLQARPRAEHLVQGNFLSHLVLVFAQLLQAIGVRPAFFRAIAETGVFESWFSFPCAVKCLCRRSLHCRTVISSTKCDKGQSGTGILLKGVTIPASERHMAGRTLKRLHICICIQKSPLATVKNTKTGPLGGTTYESECAAPGARPW